MPEDFVPTVDDLVPTFAVFLYRGDKYDGWPPASEEQANAVKGHAAMVWRVQGPGGPAIAGGPLTGDSDDLPLGLVVYRTKTLDDAEKLAAEDPAVKCGRLRAVVVPWLVRPGTIA